MAPFMKPTDGGGKAVNWQRVLELIVIVAINAAVIVTTMQVKITYMEKTMERLETVVTANNNRVNEVEAKAAICMDRLNNRNWRP